MRGFSHAPLPGGRYPAVDPHQKGPIPRMEAPIRQECPKTLHNKPTTPYQQQVQAPILSTRSAQISRGALKELMEKRSKELECQTANVGHGQGPPPRIKELFQRNVKRLQVKTHRNRQGEEVDLASDKEDCLNKDNGANLLHSEEVGHPPPLVVPPLLLQVRRVATAPGILLTSGERGGRKMLIAHMRDTSPSPLIPLPRRPTPLLLLY